MRRITRRECEARIDWFQGRMRLRDWKIDLVLQDSPMVEDNTKSSEVANCFANGLAKTAIIWLSPKRCKDVKESQAETLFHELGHVIVAEAGLSGDGRDRHNFMFDRMASAWEALYQHEKGRRRGSGLLGVC